MRLWHYKLIRNGLLPNSQLISQWRELNSIFKKQDNHILINYVYEYSKENLLVYTKLILDEMIKRGYKNIHANNYAEYFKDYISIVTLPNNKAEIKVYLGNEMLDNPFPNHHTNRYLLQCFYNLQEKYDRRQKDFDKERYEKLEEFVKKEISK